MLRFFQKRMYFSQANKQTVFDLILNKKVPSNPVYED